MAKRRSFITNKNPATTSGTIKTLYTGISNDADGDGLRNSLHGIIFQLKLLILFLIRGINSGYNFNLGTEMPGQGSGKFDDLIFSYSNSTSEPLQYRFLQAKHKQMETNQMIKSSHLQNNTNGIFSLSKYFRSYRNEIAGRGRNIQDCILCTNIGFDEADLIRNGFEFKRLETPDRILTFQPIKGSKQQPLRYQLKRTTTLDKLLHESSDLHHLANKLCEYGRNKKKKLCLTVDVFKSYHVALVQDTVIDIASGKFHLDFINGENNLKPSACNFRKILCNIYEDSWKQWTFECSKTFGSPSLDDGGENAKNKLLDDVVTDNEIDEFLDKLVFAVNMPNEKILGHILTREVGKRFKLLESDFQSDYILRKMLNLFKRRKATFLTSEQGRQILFNALQKTDSFRATSISLEYRNQLSRKYLKFNAIAVQRMANKLKPFLLLSNRNRVLNIATKSSNLTAIKISSALSTLSNFCKDEDSYLVVSSEHLGNNKSKNRLKNAMQSKKSHHLLIIVMRDGYSHQDMRCQDLISGAPRWKKMILIHSNDTSARIGLKDTIYFTDLDEKSKKKILPTKIKFQGVFRRVSQLMANHSVTHANQILNLDSMMELVLDNQKFVKIPSTKTFLEFEKSLYVKRILTLTSRLDEDFWCQLAKELDVPMDYLKTECRLDPNNIQWLVDYQQKEHIWRKITTGLINRKLPVLPSPADKSNGIFADSDFIDEHYKGKIVIISGEAGSGKSTILSHFQDKIKETTPYKWVIRIQLVDHSKYLLKQINNSFVQLSESDAIDFFIGLPGVISCDSSFSRNLLRHRFNALDSRLILMLDGFDEINSECQEVVIQLMTAISQTKLERLYVTTRSHLNDKLLNQFPVFTYQLENFSPDDQINYLTAFWKKHLHMTIEGNCDIIRQYAESIVTEASNSLNDTERVFLGIPLQCRIMAECFQEQVETILQQTSVIGKESSSVTFQNFGPNLSDFNLVTLFRMLMDTKRKIFHREKVKAEASNHMTNYSIEEMDETIDTHHLKLAIETIFTDPEKALAFSPYPSLNESLADKEKKEKKRSKLCVRFGLVKRSSKHEKLQFLHRTFAEYFVAEFLHKGFLLNKRNQNRLLDSESVQNIIIHDIFVKVEYLGVQVFLDSVMMLVVDENENLTNYELSQQLKQFSLRFGRTLLSDQYKFGNSPLFIVALCGNLNLFDFLCKCLKLVFDKTQFQNIVHLVLERQNFFYLKFEIFRRYFDYLEDANDACVKNLISKMVGYFPFLPKDSAKFTKIKHTKRALDFMLNHQQVTKRVLSKYPWKTTQTVQAFICYEADEDNRLTFFKLISDLYPNNSYLIDLLRKVNIKNKKDVNQEVLIFEEECWLDSRMEKTLITLRDDIGRTVVVDNMSSLVLRKNPSVFQSIYKPYNPSELKKGCVWSVDKRNDQDSCKMTLLHRVAFYGKVNIFEELLANNQVTVKTLRGTMMSVSHHFT